MPVRGCPTCGRGGCQRHNSRKKAARRSYSDTAAYRAMKTSVIDTYGPECVYCLANGLGAEPGPPVLQTFDRPSVATIDLDLPKTSPWSLVLAHYPVPHADGGRFELENLRPAHKWCNQQAGRHG